MNCLNFEFIIFLVCLFDLILTTEETDHFISGGNINDSYDLGKFVVSIQLKFRGYQSSRFGWYHFCGGSIISKNKVLTAAHCLYKSRQVLYSPREIVVVAGLRNRFTRTDSTDIKEVASIRSHEDYGRGKRYYADIGFLILKNDIVFDHPRKAIIGLAEMPPVSNQLCTVIGWGKLFHNGPTSDELRFADVRIMNRKACKRRYLSSFTAGMLCAGCPDNWKNDACVGDSGGPLICNRKVVGIVSWGVGCGWKNLPGVYTDVYFFNEWISNGQAAVISYQIIVIYNLQVLLIFLLIIKFLQ